MKITINLTNEEAHLIHTMIRRSIFEQYLRNMQEAGDTVEKAKDRAYNTIYAMNKIKKAIEKKRSN